MSDGHPFRPNQAAWTLLLGAIAFVYLYQAPYFEYLNNPNENVRIYTTRALVEHGTWAIDDVVEEWGYVNDKAIYEGRLYSAKAPAMALLAIPSYLVHRSLNDWLGRRASKHEIVLVGRLTVSIPLLLLFLYAFARFSDRVVTDPAIRMLAVAAVGLGSTMLTYGGMYASHALTAAALFSVYMLTYRQREVPEAIWPAVLIGFLVGLAFALEYQGGVGAAFIGLYAIHRAPRRLQFVLWSALACSIPVATVLYVHAECFGSPLAFPHQFLDNPDQVLHHTDGFYGLDGISVRALHGSLFAPSNGLFWFVPWTMVPIVGLVFSLQFRRLREPAIVTGTMLVIYVVFVSMVHNWRGGWTAGPRYIVPIIPFLGWYLIVFLAELRRTSLGLALFVTTLGLVGASLFTCGIAGAMFPHYPLGIENPTFEIAVYFLRRDYAPYTALSPFGVEGAVTLVPIAIAHGIAFVVPCAFLVDLDSVEKWAIGLAATALSVGFLAVQSVPRTGNQEGLWEMRALLGEIWEPAPPDGYRMLRGGRFPADVRYDRASAEALRAAAAEAAQVGMGRTAVDLFGEAEELRRAADREHRGPEDH